TTSALRLAPADVSFFHTSLKLKERVLALWNTKAVQAAWKTKLVQSLWSELNSQFLENAGPLAELLQAKENQELMQLLLDMASDECFLMGGESLNEFMLLAGEVFTASQFSRILNLSFGGELEDNLERMNSVLSALQDNLEYLKAPDLIAGFKVPDATVAKRQLSRLAVLLNTAALAVPQLTGNVKMQKVGESNFTTIILDGGKVPWDDLPWDQFENENGEFQELRNHLKTMRIHVSFGYHEGYILLSLGESLNFLKSLGSGKKLVELPEFDPLRQHLDKRIVSVGYSSKLLNSGSGFTQEDSEKMVAELKQLIENTDFDDELRERLSRDLKELSQDLLTIMEHEPGASMSFSYLTARGEESLQHLYSVDPAIEFTKPLDLWQHVGGQPLLAWLSRSKYKPESWDILVKWMKKLNGYVREYALPELMGIIGKEGVEKVEELLDKLYPIFQELNVTIKTNLLPALADGQVGVVVDNKLQSTQWHKELPVSTRALPLREPALLVAVSDSGKLKTGIAEVRKLFNDAMKEVRTTFSDDFPEIFWPAPESRTVEDHELFWYAFADEFQLDGRLRPSAGLSKKVASLAISNEHALRLLQPVTPILDSVPLQDWKRPLATATYFRISGLVETAQPWLEYTLEFPDFEEMKTHAEDIKTIISALHYFHSYSSATYVEKNTTVTHSEWHVKDIP
ncbi:MAG TPA: hypothetical protein PKA06_11820, partial [Gemmatales bacterium]|nr:hypothetical protein [Gemmatales bacterium]